MSEWATPPLPPRHLAPAPPLVVVGAHGGAGVRSLIEGGLGGIKLQGEWPDPSQGWPTDCVIVARTNLAGLNAAGKFVQDLGRSQVTDLRVLAFVAVADRPGKRLPRPLQLRLAELETILPVIECPWVERWRTEPYTADRLVTPIKSQVESLRFHQ